MLNKHSNNYFKDFYLTTGYKLLNLDPSRDRIAVQYIYSLINCRKVNEIWLNLREMASYRKTAVIIGPELSQLQKLQSTLSENNVLIGVDGASYTFFLKTGTLPDIVVSDLDGPLRLYYLIQEMNKYIAIHPHGDNIYRITTLNSLLQYSRLIVTSQTEDYECIRNIGGFTDGDRAVLLAVEMGFESIIICCFSREPVFFHKEIIYSRDSKTKKIKVEILYGLLEKIKELYGDRVKFIS
ncbi:MAG: DUF115 domain-containing protein [Desulfurococcales archaeon]|nr:DUF115 domain-containing protein [Desulfurococcales archaeon]